MNVNASASVLAACKPWTRAEIAANAAHDIPEGFYVNLGIGIPVLIADHLPADREIVIQSENGVLGMGPAPEPDKINRWLINASSQYVTLRSGGSYMSHSDSFALVRGGQPGALVAVRAAVVTRVRGIERPQPERSEQGAPHRPVDGAAPVRRKQVVRERHGEDLVGTQARVGAVVADDVVKVALLAAPERLVEASGVVPGLRLELAGAPGLTGDALESRGALQRGVPQRVQLDGPAGWRHLEMDVSRRTRARILPRHDRAEREGAVGAGLESRLEPRLRVVVVDLVRIDAARVRLVDVHRGTRDGSGRPENPALDVERRAGLASRQQRRRGCVLRAERDPHRQRDRRAHPD